MSASASRSAIHSAARAIAQDKFLLMPLEAPLFYTNPLAGEYQDYVGGNYHAMEIFNFFMDASDMLDTKNPTAYLYRNIRSCGKR